MTTFKALELYYQTGATHSPAFRITQLKNLRQAVLKFESKIQEALHADLHKNAEEAWVTETGFLLSEINFTIKHLRSWLLPETHRTNLINFPSSSKVFREPKGVVLIIGPWNYPLQLLFTPLVGAIAGGNCVVVKPSEHAPATAAVMEEIIRSTFPPEYISCIQGDGATVIPQAMENFRFNHIFYTGSTEVGRVIYQQAAKQLIPVTLELGGKSPCIVEADANIKVAARRIALAKFSNAGQMCVTPDYVLAHHSVKSALLSALQQTIIKFFGENSAASRDYGRIINQKQFDRLIQSLQGEKIIYGGNSDSNSKYIQPTIVDEPSPESRLMKEEIFGPILPVLSFNTTEEAKAIINRNPDPLALYVFTSDKKKEEEWMRGISFGGGCVNNAAWHLTNPRLPFGGVGGSGFGAYHGRYSFDTFTHPKAIMKTPTWFDPKIKYPPFAGKMGLFKKIQS